MENDVGEESDFIVPDIIEDLGSNEDGHDDRVFEKKILNHLYLLITENKPVFPGMIFPLSLSAGFEVDVVRFVFDHVPEKVLGFVLLKSQEDHSKADHLVSLYRVGTVVRILKIQPSDDGGVQVLLRCESRFRIVGAQRKQEHYEADVVYPVEILDSEDEEVKALCLAILSTMKDLTKQNSLFSEEMKMILSRTDWSEPSRLADFAAMTTSAPREELQQILEMFDVKQRLSKILFILRNELDLNILKEKITHQIEERINHQQREFFLKEQLKVIKQELGLEKDEKEEEVRIHQERLDLLEVPESTRKVIQEEIEKLKLLPSQSPEYGVCRGYLDWLTSLPWNKTSKDRLDVEYGRQLLDRDHYGLEDVKLRILEFIGVAKLKGTIEGTILCLVGPPGVGKTSIGKAIAKTLGRKFYRFSLGGMRDEAEIKGHRRTYIGALPGKFIQAIKDCGTCNPVIMLDEIDKIGNSFQGDPASALLEVLDPEQNCAFRDHYLDVPFDLSKVLFIATANVIDTIPAPLFDRMETIRLSGYIMDEKLQIAKRYLIPKLLVKNGLTKKQFRIHDRAIQLTINCYARESGVRSLEKNLNTMIRKVAMLFAENKIVGSYVVDCKKVSELLGRVTFEDDPLFKKHLPGVAMGLAWTIYGGSTLYIETVSMPGKGGFKITGQIGSVMNESSQIAFSFIMSNLKKFSLSPKKMEEQTLHIHIPAGATPKDGPSAGVTLITSILSLLLKKALPSKIAMTGEVTLTGMVLPVGGIKEKMIAAIRSGVKTVYLPKLNQKDFDEIPEYIRKGLTLVFVSHYDDIFEALFLLAK